MKSDMKSAVTPKEVLAWLMESRPDCLDCLWNEADRVRKSHVGDEVHLRGLIEISNICSRQCHYCGIRTENTRIERYRMTSPEILDCARLAKHYGFGTVVIQSGEDPGIHTEWVADLIGSIKRETDLAVTLSLGERPEEDYRTWFAAGADRYLLRFETSNLGLFRRIHPPAVGMETDRLKIIPVLGRIGYETGSGVMIGIPGQSYRDLARDIILFRDLGLDMIGVGPYIPHPDTPLGKTPQASRTECSLTPEAQVPNSELMAYKTIALTRILCPDSNIPSTTALATVNREAGRELGLMRGANVIMPNLTPQKYRSRYEIYPSKAGPAGSIDEYVASILSRMASIGRKPGQGRGDSKTIPGR